MEVRNWRHCSALMSNAHVEYYASEGGHPPTVEFLHPPPTPSNSYVIKVAGRAPLELNVKNHRKLTMFT